MGLAPRLWYNLLVQQKGFLSLGYAQEGDRGTLISSVSLAS